MSEQGSRERLLDAFAPPAAGEWEAEVRRLLKGRPLDSLVSCTLEGIDLHPLYTRADLEGIAHVDTAPGAPPFVRGTRALGARAEPWAVAQIMPHPEPAAVAAALAEDLPRGLTAAALALDRAGRRGLDPDDPAAAGLVGRGGTSIAGTADLAEALAPVDLARTPLRLCAGPSVLPAGALVVALARARGIEPAALSGFLGFDPLAELAWLGLPLPLDRAYDELAAWTRWTAAQAPRLRTVAARGFVYHEGGGSAVHELAFTLAAAVEHLRRLEARGLAIDEVAPRLEFGFQVGTRFFLELAKLRAARLLWSRVVELAGGRPGSGRMLLHCRTSRLVLTIFDAPTNLLRGTVAALAAVLGGCDSLHVEPFDAARGLPSDLARRLARNTQLILREESRCDRIVDPAGGSYHVEKLTDELARAAWALFQEVEAAGGLAAALAAGMPQARIAQTAARRRREVAMRRDTIVGVNKYADPGESPPPLAADDLEAVARRRADRLRAARASGEAAGLAAALRAVAAAGPEAWLETAATAAGAGATLGDLVRALREGVGPGAQDVAPIPGLRAAQEFEQLRLAALRRRASRGAAPDVFLVNLGPTGRYMPRLDFIRGFFQAGGFAVGGEDAWSHDPREAAAVALGSGAPAVCLVGLDETYVEAVPACLAALRESKGARLHVMLAGRPPLDAERFAAAGVDEFVTAGGDALAALQNLARRLGALEPS